MASDYHNDTDQQLPRGIRNNNPGNIKDDGTAWQGVVGSDGTFLIFSDMSWGVRAMATSITNMVNKGLNTIDLLIRSWSATDQDAYVANVAQAVGVDPNQVLALDAGTLARIIRAMITQENGTAFTQYVTDDDIQSGIALMSNKVASLLQASVVYAQANPAQAIIVLVAIAVALGLAFRRD
jgi:hypothetical protein